MKTARKRYYNKQGSLRGGGRRKGISLRGWFAVTGIVAIIMVLTYKGLVNSDFFQVTTIKIEGNNRVSKERILELSGVDIHTNLLGMDKDLVMAKLGKYDWLEEAEVKRQLPNRVIISVREREPLAMVNLEGEMYYVDRMGVIFSKVLSSDDMDYPVISGLTAKTKEQQDSVLALEEALRFIRYASRGDHNLPAQNISEIDISNKDDMVMFLMSRPFPIHLGRGKPKQNYARLARVLYRLYKRNEFDVTAYIDVGYLEDRVLVGRVTS